MKGDLEFMPEVPEMEIYKNYLNQWVRNKRIVEANVLRAKSVNQESSNFIRAITGKEIIDIIRRGKYLIF